MNTVDQAFIKAFAKQRPAACSVPEPMTTGAKDQPPDPGVESAPLMLHNPHPQGLRYRIDRPTSSEAGVLATHIIMPSVEQVQSYEPADLATSTLAQVVVEDRLQALEEALQELKQSAMRGPSAKPHANRRPGRGSTEGEDEGADEDPVAAAVKPLVLMAVPQLYRPDLQSTELGCLTCLDPARVRRSTTVVELGGCDLDPLPLDESPDADRVEHAAPCEAPAAAGTWERLDEDVAEIMSKASDVDDVLLPVDAEVAPARHGLTEAEEAALRGEVEPAVRESFVPAWEVDAFRWPELCTRLDETSGRKLTRSGDELYMAMQDGLQVIAITSAARQEGRTTIALSLARSAAAAGCRVALLDADCLQPELAGRLGLDAPCDWQQVKRRCEPLCEAAVASLDDRVTLFPLTAPDNDLWGRLNDATFTAVLQELKRAFDLVVVDAQPVAASDAQVAAASGPCEVDMALVVRNVQTTSQDTCLATVARLRAMGVRAIGIVENFLPTEEAAL